jgi:hypothetical protein
MSKRRVGCSTESGSAGRPVVGMRIPFPVSGTNDLRRRAQVALTALGDVIDVAVGASPLEIEAAIACSRPELIV